MKWLRPQEYVLIILGLVLAAQACVPGQRSGSVKDVRSQDKNASSADAEQDSDQSESVSPPVPITGSYLHCEIFDKEIATENRADVACRIDDGSTKRKVDLTQSYKVANFLHQKPDDPNIVVSGAVADPASLFHVLYTFQGGTEPLTLDTLKNFLVMFRASPKTALDNEFIFSARLTKGEALLPENFPVYYANGTIINNPAPGFERRILPTVNHTYPSIDGCYIACYSNSSTNAVYEIGPGIFVMGQFRVKGLYAGRLCQGDGFQNAPDIAQIPEYKAACSKHLPACAGDICWGGNDTGGWFGFQ